MFMRVARFAHVAISSPSKRIRPRHVVFAYGPQRRWFSITAPPTSLFDNTQWEPAIERDAGKVTSVKGSAVEGDGVSKGSSEAQRERLRRHCDYVLSQLETAELRDEGHKSSQVQSRRSTDLASPQEQHEDLAQRFAVNWIKIQEVVAANNARIPRIGSILKELQQHANQAGQEDYRWGLNLYALITSSMQNGHDLKPVLRFENLMRFRDFVSRMRMDVELHAHTPAMEIADSALDRLNSMIPQRKPSRVWNDLMICLLQYFPALAPEFILKSLSTSSARFRRVEQAVEYLMFVLSSGVQSDLSSQIGSLSQRQLFELIKGTMTSGRAGLRSSRTDGLLTVFGPELGMELYDQMRSITAVQSWTKNDRSFHFASFATSLAKHGRFEQALQVLEDHVMAGGQADGSYRSAAWDLLYFKMKRVSRFEELDDTVQRLTKSGVLINHIFSKPVAMKAFKAGKPQHALAIFHRRREIGANIDSSMYSAMLDGLKTAHKGIHDSAIEELVSLCWAHAVDAKDALLAQNIITFRHTHLVNGLGYRESLEWLNGPVNAKNYSRVLRETVSLYARFFDPAPLRALGLFYILPDQDWFPPGALNLKPTPIVMHVMLLAYSRALVGMNHGKEFVVQQARTNEQLYMRWRSIALEPHSSNPEMEPWIKDLFLEQMRSTNVLTTFIHALGYREDTLMKAVQLMAEMNKGYIEHPSDKNVGSEQIKIRTSDQVTWNALMNGFARFGMYDAAEKLFDKMKANGIRQDLKTWCTLLKAYSRADYLEGVKTTLQRMQRAKLVDDGMLWTSLYKITDKEAMAGMLEKLFSPENSITERDLLGMKEAESRKKQTWAPSSEKTLDGYEPGVGARNVQYFDANRALGLHGDAAAYFEADDAGPGGLSALPVSQARSPQILVDQGEFALKSDDQEDWFEAEEENSGAYSPIVASIAGRNATDGLSSMSTVANANGVAPDRPRQILRNMGSFVLKSEEKEDWFESDEATQVSLSSQSPLTAQDASSSLATNTATAPLNEKTSGE